MLNYYKISGARGRNRTGTGLPPRDFKCHNPKLEKLRILAELCNIYTNISTCIEPFYSKFMTHKLLQQNNALLGVI